MSVQGKGAFGVRPGVDGGVELCFVDLESLKTSRCHVDRADAVRIAETILNIIAPEEVSVGAPQ